jgi:signal peptidase I
MKIIEILFRLVFEFIVDVLLFIVGHYRDEASFARRELAHKPVRDFFNSTFNMNLKPKTPKKAPQKDKHSLNYKIVSLIIAVLAILWIRHSVVEPYKIPTGSMIPTLKIGDHIFVNKLAYGLRLPFLGEVWSWGNPSRGEVFIFTPPINPDVVFVKRVIGLPGDTIRIDDDKLYINDKFIDRVPEPFYPAMEAMGDEKEKYDEADSQLYIEDLLGTKHYVLLYKDRDYQSLNRTMEITIPENCYFAMGDNRDHSQDSRFWGCVKRDAVKGRALFIWLSLNNEKLFTPAGIRFSRIGKFVR